MFSSLPNLHPFLVHFPIALFSTALVCDVALLVRFRRSWLDRTAVLLYVTAALSSGAAAVSGKLAERSMAEHLEKSVVELVGSHGDWAFFSVVLFFAMAFFRFDAIWRDRAEPEPRASRSRLAVLALALVAEWAVLQTASRGGELVYRHAVGIERDRGIIRDGR